MTKKETNALAENKEHDHFAEWCQMTGWHGVLDFYMAKHMFWKIAWLLIVLTGCFFAINQSVCMIMDFANDDQWTTSVSYEMPKDGRLEWPNITICELSTISPSSDDDIESARNETTLAAQVDDDDLAFILSTDLCRQLIVDCGTINSNTLTYYSMWQQCCQNSTENKDKTCYNMKPNEALFSNKNKNKGNQRLYYVLTNNGLFGSEVRLYMGESDSVDDFSTTFYTIPGARTLISMVSELHRLKLKQRLIQFSKVRMPCNKNYTYLNAATYTKELCVTDCRIQWQHNFCGCYVDENVNFPVKVAKRCNDSIGRECTTEYECIIKKLLHPSDDEVCLNEEECDCNYDEKEIEMANCANNCPEPCEYGHVEAKISSAIFDSSQITVPSNYYADAEKQRWTMLELYYEIKQQRIVEKTPRISVDELISNIGGCLGVWSGISFLSVIQIFVFLFRAIGHCIAVRRAKRLSQTQVHLGVKTTQTASRMYND